MIRRFLDRFLLNDHEWKKKYCPTLYSYLFGTEEERHRMFEQIIKNKPTQEEWDRLERDGIVGTIKI